MKLDSYHVTLLLKRRLKTGFLVRKNIITILIGLSSTAFFLGSLIVYFKDRYETTSRMISETSDMKTRYFLEFKNLKLFILFSGLTGTLMALIPCTACTTFNSEYEKVRKEMAAGTYSVTSYYISVLLFELISTFLTFVIAMVGSKVLLSNWVDFGFVFTNLLIYFFSISAYLLSSTMFRDSKRNVMLFILCLIYNAAPIAVAMFYFKIKQRTLKAYKEGRSWFLLAPNYLLSLCPISSKWSRFLEEFNQQRENITTESLRWAVAKNIILFKDMRTIVTVIPIPVPFNYFLSLVQFIVYFLMCIYRLSNHLSANYRMRLNKK